MEANILKNLNYSITNPNTLDLIKILIQKLNLKNRLTEKKFHLFYNTSVYLLRTALFYYFFAQEKKNLVCAGIIFKTLKLFKKFEENINFDENV